MRGLHIFALPALLCALGCMSGCAGNEMEYTINATGISCPGVSETEVRAMEWGDVKIGTYTMKDSPIGLNTFRSDSCVLRDSSGVPFGGSFFGKFKARPGAKRVQVAVAFSGRRPVILEDEIKLRRHGDNTLLVTLLSGVMGGGTLKDYAPAEVFAKALADWDSISSKAADTLSGCREIRDLSTQKIVYLGGARGQALRMSILPPTSSDVYGTDGFAISEIYDHGDVVKTVRLHYKACEDHLDLYLEADGCSTAVQRLNFLSGGKAALYNLVSDDRGFLCTLERVGRN